MPARSRPRTTRSKSAGSSSTTSTKRGSGTKVIPLDQGAFSLSGVVLFHLSHRTRLAQLSTNRKDVILKSAEFRLLFYPDAVRGIRPFSVGSVDGLKESADAEAIYVLVQAAFERPSGADDRGGLVSPTSRDGSGWHGGGGSGREHGPGECPGGEDVRVREGGDD